MDKTEDKPKTRFGKQFLMRPSQSRLAQKKQPSETNEFESIDFIKKKSQEQTTTGEWQIASSQKKPSSSSLNMRENLRDAFNNLNIIDRRQVSTQNPSLRGSLFSSQHVARDKQQQQQLQIQETQNPRPIKNFVYNNSISDSTKLTRTGSTNQSGFRRQQNIVKDKMDNERKQQIFEEEDKDEEIQFMLLCQTLEKAL